MHMLIHKCSFTLIHLLHKAFMAFKKQLNIKKIQISKDRIIILKQMQKFSLFMLTYFKKFQKTSLYKI